MSLSNSKWQPLPMIPVVLQLLKEYYEGQQGYPGTMGYQIHAYEKIFEHWNTLEGLTPIQKKWLVQIDDYIQALQKKHTIFSPMEKKFPEDTMINSDWENNPRSEKTSFSY